MSRAFIVAGAVLAASVWVAVAGAAGNQGATLTFTADTGPFVFSSAVCDELESDITLSGTVHGVVHESVDAHGVVHVAMSTAVQGTGTDGAGGTYRFNYHQAGAAAFAGFPFSIQLTDHFNLTGSGGANRVHTGFVITFTFENESDPPELEITMVIGDAEHCDPL